MRVAAACLVLLLVAGGLVAATRTPEDRDAPRLPAPRGQGPRTPAVPATTATLGPWRFRADPRDRGLALDWRRDVPGGRRVAVPHTANPGPVRGPAAEAVQAGSVGWYETTVRVARGGRHVLRFAGAHHRAVAWVDGRLLGAHTGAYAPFAFRTRLGAGVHRVVVRVDWRDPDMQSRTGFRRAWFNHGGLLGPVTLTRLSRSEIGDAALETRLAGRGRARVVVRVRVRNASAARRLEVRGALRRGRTSVPLRFGAVELGRRRSATLEAVATVPRSALWSPRAPRRWDLAIGVPGETALRRRVGLRELRWDGGRLRLNGRPLRLRGASLPPNLRGRGEALGPRERAEVVRELRAIGANATRSQRPLDEGLLAALDAAGILVWMEVGPFEPAAAWWATTPARRERATARALQAVRAARLHPSVVAWSLTNEAARAGHPGGQAEWVDATARAVKRADPTRPVAADLWGRALPAVAGTMHRSLDAVGVTDYHGWYEAPLAAPAEQEALARARVERVLRLFPDKVVVVTEFGAGGTGRGAALGTEDVQAELLHRRISTFEAVPGLDGAVVWTLRDFAVRPDFDGGSIRDVAPAVQPPAGLLDKGLFRFDGTPKPAVRAVRAAFARR